ncbi:MAG: hypothetical protein ACH34Y_02250 [Brachymonas sp.]
MANTKNEKKKHKRKQAQKNSACAEYATGAGLAISEGLYRQKSAAKPKDRL